MVHRRRLTYEERVNIQVLRDEGYSIAAIADKMKCSHTVSVSKTLFKSKETGTLKDRMRSGRPRISSSREDRVLARISI